MEDKEEGGSELYRKYVKGVTWLSGARHPEAMRHKLALVITTGTHHNVLL